MESASLGGRYPEADFGVFGGCCTIPEDEYLNHSIRRESKKVEGVISRF